MSGKKSFLFMFFVLSILTVSGCAIRRMPEYEKNPTLPQVQGILKVPGLNGEVKIYRDKWGVPHIFTEDEHDLFFANGYVQAQDRLWEMVLFRALAEGRLCELFGNIGIPGETIMGMELTTFGIDKRQRIMGMKLLGEVGEVILAELDPDMFSHIQAYCDGINAFIRQNKNRLPIEFQILYIEPEPFRVADIVSLSRFYGSMLCANLDMELMRYALAKKLGEEIAWKLAPLHESPGPTVVPKELLKNRLPSPRALTANKDHHPSELGLTAESAMLIANAEKAMRKALLFPNYFASNNWIVSPKITQTGSAMLANDPHLIHIQPSLSYIMHIKGAGYDAYGIVFPGQPYIVLGHTRRLSWGATVTSADVQDLFVETVSASHPGKYLYKGEWREFVVRKEIIKIRPGIFHSGPTKRFKEKEIEIRHSIHGPIINDIVPNLPEDSPPLALRWTGWDFTRDVKYFEMFINCATVEEFKRELEKVKGEIKIINVGKMFDLLNKGNGIEDFIKAMEYNELLNMNWVSADADGHIAYLPGGLVPIRKKGIGVMPVPGENGDYDWSGFIPLMEHPYVIDPERGYMATANNKVVDLEWYPYVFGTNYDDGWRAFRIEELIQKYKPITVEKMRLIQNDVYVKQAEFFVPLIIKAVEKKGVTEKRVLEATKILKEWNYEATIDSVGTSIFYDTMSHLPDVILMDEFDKKIYKDWIQGNVSTPVQMWVLKGESEFFDDKRTKNKVEDVNDVLVSALKEAIKWLTDVLGKDMSKWQWGKLHTIKWYHPMGFFALKEMSIGPFPHPGGENTVRNASSMGFGSRKYMCFEGPVLRHIIDMKDPDNALVVIDGSESGQWLSPHYKDMHTLWYNSQYITAEKRALKIKEEAESELTLIPED